MIGSTQHIVSSPSKHVGVVDGGDIARPGHVLRLGWPLPGNWFHLMSILDTACWAPDRPLVMSVRAQQALLRQRGVCVTSSQECFLVPLDQVVAEGVEEMDKATLQ
jgi:hypothetical protein